MKVIVVDIDAQGQPVGAELIADSAVNIQGKPLFVPDFSDSWKAEMLAAVRISRLGKDIKPKFAERYFDAVTLALHTLPEDVEGFGADCLSLYDGCMAFGKWIAADNLPADLSAETSGGPLRLENFRVLAGKIISALSCYCTLKMGDTIVVRDAAATPLFPLKAGENIWGKIDNMECLDLKIR